MEIDPELVDSDGSETLSIFIDGNPDGSLISDGTNSVTTSGSNSSIEVTNWDLNQIQVELPAGYSGTYNATARVRSTESNGDFSETTQTAQLNVGLTPPIVIDLDGDGLELITLDESDVSIDLDNDGDVENTAWVGRDDGFIITDLDGDRTLSSNKELFIAQQTTEHDTDLEALATLYDSNQDGILNALDDRFDDVLIFQDENQDGKASDGEIFTLQDMNIQEIKLDSDNNQQHLSDGSVIHGQTTYSRIDGTEGIVGDVSLAYTDGSPEQHSHDDLNTSNSHTSGNTLKTLISDAGDDLFIINHDDVTATGGRGADTFDFNINDNSNNPADLIITDFNTNEGDLLKLDDILVDASDSLDQHFHFVASGSDTIMEIRPEVDGDITRRVTFKDVNLLSLGNNDNEILNSLINNNNLDHGE